MDNLTTVFFLTVFYVCPKEIESCCLEESNLFFSVTLTVFTPNQQLFIHLLVYLFTFLFFEGGILRLPLGIKLFFKIFKLWSTSPLTHGKLSVLGGREVPEQINLLRVSPSCDCIN